jgi:3-dehydroquinate synthase
MGYGVWLHGEAVAAGTMMAANLSKRLGWLSAAEVERIARIFKAANLPIQAPDLGVDKYIDLMGLDKKVIDGKIRLVLQQGIGKSVVTSDYDPQALHQTLTMAI